MVKLGVNIDHIATLRNARGGTEPEPLMAAFIAQLAGADGITVHLREDRRHIKDRDLRLLKETIDLPLNLEMACEKEIIEIAKQTRPHMCTLVPEKRQEITTEGGLDVLGSFYKIKSTVAELGNNGIQTSLFIDPDPEQVAKSAESGATYVEFHTGSYAEASCKNIDEELNKIIIAAEVARNLGLIVNAGHGLNYNNIRPVLQIEGLYEVNIGHSIIARAVFKGLETAIKDMKDIIISETNCAGM